MRSIRKYVDLLESKSESTKSNSERIEKLKKWLKNKKYSEYVKSLDKMLEDPKAKVLLQDGFGGDLGDIDFDFEVKLLPAKSLMPTQSEIDVKKSLEHALTNPKNIKDAFNSEEIVVNDSPIVTFRGNYVIDGHHRWSEIAMVNPEGLMMCYDYDAPISPIQMLKAVQGAIAAVIADDKDAELPKSEAKSQNIYDNEWDVKKVEKYINKTITDDVVEELCKYYEKCNKKEDVVKIIVDNIMTMKVDNPPIHNSQERDIMPQPDKAGTDRKDKETSKKTSKPDDKGSALSKMKDGKFEKDVL